MKSFDELLTMTDQEKLDYLKEEVEKVISKAEPHNVLKLRHIQAQMDGIRARVHNPQVSAKLISDEMIKSFYELNGVLNGKM